MWTIARIDEADYGCEERLPGEPLMLLITLESDNGEVIKFETEENWIEMQGLDEGDEWPEEIETEDTEAQSIAYAKDYAFYNIINRRAKK